MTSRISHTTIDARDAYAQSVWWGRVLGMSEDPEDPNEPGHEECMIFSPDGRTRVLFLVVPEAKPSSRTASTSTSVPPTAPGTPRSNGCSASAPLWSPTAASDGSGWFTLADPEGNEFCVLRGDSEISNPYAHLNS